MAFDHNLYRGGLRIAGHSDSELFRDFPYPRAQQEKELVWTIESNIADAMSFLGLGFNSWHNSRMYMRNENLVNIYEVKNKGALLIARIPITPISEDYTDIIYQLDWLVGEIPDGLKNKIEKIFEHFGFDKNFDMSKNLQGEEQDMIITGVSVGTG